MRIGELRDKCALRHFLLIGTGNFPRRQLHAFDAVDPRPAGHLHIAHRAAFAGREVVHPPRQRLAGLRDKEPTHQLLPFDGKRRPAVGFDRICGQGFGQLFQMAFSFRVFGRVWIFFFEALPGRMQPAFYRPDRDAEPFGDLRLRQRLPVIQIENLLVLVSQQVQSLPHGVHLGDALPSGRQFPFGQLVDRNCVLRRLPAEEIGALVPSDAEDPRLKGFPVFELRKFLIGRQVDLLQHIVRIRLRMQPEPHKALDGRPLGRQIVFKFVHKPHLRCQI